MNLVTCEYPTNRLIRHLPDLSGLLTPSESPATRFQEDKDNYHVQVDLPGVRKEDVKIQVEAGQLRVEAERHLGREGQTKSYAISRAFLLPDEVNAEKIVAEQKDGVLSLTLPKKEETKPKTVRISVN